ncbi:MAG: AAA family ATPase [Actinomycetia bacterium]|nr:AAA family ATPase [Actinomycetes bacterium]
MSLVQRDSAWARLEAALDACRRGTTGVVLVEGAVGCGKTELLTVLSDEAGRGGANVLRAAGTPSLRDEPYAVVRRLVADLPDGLLPAEPPPVPATPGGHRARPARPGPELPRSGAVLPGGVRIPGQRSAPDAGQPQPDPEPDSTGPGTSAPSSTGEPHLVAVDGTSTGEPQPADEEGTFAAPGDPGGYVAAPFTAEEFGCALRALAEQAPLVVCVDDLRYVDARSLGYLLHAVRTLRGTALLLVLADVPQERAEQAPARTELLRHPSYARIAIGRLDEAGTAALLSRHAGRAATPELTARLQHTTGGNPLLLRALLTEPTAPEPEHGGPFTEAVLTCLHRGGTRFRRLATVLAVLDAEATVENAARVARLTPSATARTMDVLDRAGLTRAGRLRHPAITAAVLDATPGRERGELHSRAAQVLQEGGGHADVVARHLLAAAGDDGLRSEPPVGDWPLRVLCEAAKHALVSADDCVHAAACLQLARTLCTDEHAGLDVDLRRAGVVWRLHPGAAEAHLRAPLAALREGALSPARTGRLARLLVAQGRMEEAAEALGHLTGLGAAPREDPLRELFALPPAPRPADAPAASPAASGTATPGGTGTAVAGGTAPVAATQAAADEMRDGRELPARSAAALRAAAALWTHPGAEGDEQAVERLLKGTPLAHNTFEPIVQAVRTLVHLDRPDRAALWCRRLSAAAGDSAPAWRAVFGTVHAEGLLRLGDLAGAEREAAAAADTIADRGGLFLFAPVAALATALTGMGRYEEATRRLQTPAPDELFSSVHALTYLRARGHYYMATHRYRAALGEFLDVGRLAHRWSLDRPRQIPWRTDAAEALLQLGERRRAERFVVEQLGMPDARGPRVRGVSLRLRAATAELHQRPKLLTAAVDELRRCGDRIELARALSDLGRALRLTGEDSRAGIVTRRAWQLAAECRAVPLCEQISPGQSGRGRQDEEPPAAPQRPEPAPSRTEQLSEAERRVAALAGYGYTNREISARLYITVSTVEQHLTRAYRKLKITRRQDLPMELQLDLVEDVFQR